MSLATASLNRAANSVLGSSDPVTIYAALFTGASSALVGGTEATGTSYARKAITNNRTNFPEATAGAVTSANAFAFAESGGAWAGGAALNCIRFYDASSGGNLLAGSMIRDTGGTTISLYVTGAGQTITIPAAALTLTVS